MSDARSAPRLIDHFKRAYQVIVGLAITLACTKLFPEGKIHSIDITLWSFCTLFITVVPIFHGGDRSLDLKYLDESPEGFWKKASYIWDVYMLLITAIFFVKIAQALPGSSASFLPSFGFASGKTVTDPTLFYQWMSGMLYFDVGVLLVDWFKTGILGLKSWRDLNSYWGWIIANFLLAYICNEASLSPLGIFEIGVEATGMVILRPLRSELLRIIVLEGSFFSLNSDVFIDRSAKVPIVLHARIVSVPTEFSDTYRESTNF